MAEPNRDAEQSAAANDPDRTDDATTVDEDRTSGQAVAAESGAAATRPVRRGAGEAAEVSRVEVVDVARAGEDERPFVAARTESDTAAIAAPAETQPVLEPAQPTALEAPRKEGNRLVGTAWVLLAAGLFELLYFAALAGLIAVIAAAQGASGQVGQVVAAQLQPYLSTPFAWLPVLFFFLLFELTVLLFNRAGRFLYVVASLIVGVLTYVVSVLLISILVRGSIGDASTLEQTFLIPQFILIGLVSREVMLWTGVAIGARGGRVRRRNRARREAYRAETSGGAAG